MKRSGFSFTTLLLFALLFGSFFPIDTVLEVFATSERTPLPLPQAVSGPYDNHIIALTAPLPRAALSPDAITADDIPNLEVQERLADTLIVNPAFSQDGRLLGAFVSDGSTIEYNTQYKIWDMETRELLTSLPVYRGETSVFSPDARYVVFSNYPTQGWIEVWEIESASRIRQYQGGTSPEIGFSADGQRMWAGRIDGYQIWNFADGSLIEENYSSCCYLAAYDYSDDFSHEARFSEAANAVIVQQIDGSNRREFPLPSSFNEFFVFTLSFSPSRRYVAISDYQGRTWLLNLENPDLSQEIILEDIYSGPPYVWSPDETILILGGSTNTELQLIFWDVAENRVIRQTDAYTYGTSFSPDGSYLMGVFARMSGDEFEAGVEILAPR
jgi:WD40 repeat protein